MGKHPHVPEENRSPYAGDHDPAEGDIPGAKSGDLGENPGKRGQTANTEQNTTHQGYQQDR